MGETSRVITLFTQEKGKLKSVAKGARKSAAKKGSALELFSHVACIIYRKENVELSTLTSVDLIDSYTDIAADPVKFGFSSAYCEIIDKSVSDNQPIPELYELTGLFFTAILKSDKAAVSALFWAAFLQTLTILGYRPQLNECVVCGKQNKGRAAFYDPDRGGIICSKDVLPNVSYGKLSAAGLKTLRDFLTQPLNKIVNVKYSEKVLSEIEQFILTFANYHAGLHRNLKSFKFLSQLKRK